MNNEKMQKLGFWLAMASMLYLTIILMVKDTPINLATWLLWFVIDFAVIASLIRAKKRYSIVMAYTVWTAAILLLTMPKFLSGTAVFEWGTAEKVVVGAVVVALVVWKCTTDNVGVVMTTLAMVVAGIPTWISTYHRPDEVNILFWTLSAMGCAFFCAGSPKKFVDRFMPASGVISNGIIATLGLRQFL